MYSGLGQETMNGGLGIDTIDHTAWNGDYTFDMTTGTTNFAGESYLNFENVRMGGGNDTVTGTAGANNINGGAGNDLIIGGLGRDVMDGGLGADTFDFNATNESPAGLFRDVINNFNWGQGDKIDLSTIDANVLLAGDQAFDLSQLNFDSATGTLTADVLFSGSDLQISLVGFQPGFSTSIDIIE